MKKVPTWAVVFVFGAIVYLLYRAGGTTQIKRDAYRTLKGISERSGGLIPEPSRDFWLPPAQPSGGGFSVGLGHLFPDGLFPSLPSIPSSPYTAGGTSSGATASAGYPGFTFGVGLN